MSIVIGSNTKIKNSIIGRDKRKEKELEKEIERLNNIINKAIEYIESRHIKAGVELMSREKELLDILKGSDTNK